MLSRVSFKTMFFSTLLLVMMSITPQLQYVLSLDQWILTCRLPGLAVTDEGRGLVVEVELTIAKPGNGQILVNENVGDDILTSFKYALIHASIITGENYMNYNYHLRPDIRVRGLSATLLFYIAIVEAFTSGKCPTGISATGIILPGGVIEGVRGLGEKIEAASRRGLVVYGEWSQIREFADRYVRGLYTVYDAYEELVETRLTNIDIQLEEYLVYYNQVFREPYITLVNQAKRVVDELESIGWLDEDLNTSLRLLREAEIAARDRGKYYASSSLAFRALIHAYVSRYRYLRESLGEEEAFRYLRETATMTMSEINDTIEEALEEALYMFESGYIELSKLDILIASYHRSIEASLNLEVFLLNPGEDTLRARAAGAARSLSARAWLDIAKSSTTLPFAKNMSRDDVYTALWYLRDYWDTTIKYLKYMDLVLGNESFLIPPRTPSGEIVHTVAISHWLYTRILEANITRNDLDVLFDLVSRTLRYVYSNTGFIPVESLLVMDLSKIYMELGYEPSLVADLLLASIAKSTYYLLLHRGAGWSTPGIENGEKRVLVSISREYVLTALLTSLVLAFTGMMLISTRRGIGREQAMFLSLLLIVVLVVFVYFAIVHYVLYVIRY